MVAEDNHLIIGAIVDSAFGKGTDSNIPCSTTLNATLDNRRAWQELLPPRSNVSQPAKPRIDELSQELSPLYMNDFCTNGSILLTASSHQDLNRHHKYWGPNLVDRICQETAGKIVSLPSMSPPLEGVCRLFFFSFSSSLM